MAFGVSLCAHFHDSETGVTEGLVGDNAGDSAHRLLITTPKFFRMALLSSVSMTPVTSPSSRFHVASLVRVAFLCQLFTYALGTNRLLLNFRCFAAISSCRRGKRVRYLAPATRERIVSAGAGYVDLTGNIYISNDRPALLVRDRGADRDPWRGPGRPRGTLKGPPAARVVRSLIDFAPPYSAPELAERAGASTGATYRVIKFLEEQQLVEREQRGQITKVRWRPLLERWNRDYGFAMSNTVATFLEPRGLTELTDRLTRRAELEYVLTGSLAAERTAAYAPARLAMLYVRDIDSAATLLELRQTSTGANVALAAGDYDVVFERTQKVDGLRLAAVSQVAVDLLTGPGRNPSEAAALLGWMEHNEAA